MGMVLSSWLMIATNLVISNLLLFPENIFVTMGFNPTGPSCMNSSCQLSFDGPAHCYCDLSCTTYGDCCHDANVSKKSPPNSRFSCQKESIGYWMITSCSPSWIAEQVADGVANGEDIVSSCEDPSVRATYRFLPPVTDEETGLVYRNEFCARCNGLQPSDLTGWRIQLTCTSSTELNSQTSLLFSQLIKLCEVEHYLPPKSVSSPRPCKSLSGGLIYSCPEGGPADPTTNCTSRGINLVQFGNSVYANEYCAACWNVNSTLINCVNELILPPVIMEGIRNITILLDINGTQRTATSTSTTYHIVDEACPSGSVYDKFQGSCRMASSANCTNLTAVTLEGGSYTLLDSDNVFWKSYNLSVPIESVDTNGRPLVCIPSVESTICVPIFLESNDYIKQDKTLMWKSNNSSYIIEGYDEGGRPLICTNSTEIINQMPRKPFFTLPVGADILTYIGFAIDFVSGVLFLLTFFLFKELRTFFSKLMAHFVLAILLGDVMYLAVGPLFTYFQKSELCIAFGIFVHYAFLCRFSWMSVMGSELVRNFYNVRRVKKDTANKWKLLSVYMLVAWLSPLVVVIPTIIVNFTVENSVNYGVGVCLINHPVGMAVSFGVPVLFSIAYNTIAFIIVIVIVVQMRKGSKSEDLGGPRKQSPQKDVRFAFALFTLTGLSWLFIFFAMFSPALSWAWYLFVIFNTTQALAVSIAFIFTGKVLRLYGSLLCCLCRRRHTMSSASTTRKPQIAETNSEP